MPVNVRQKRVEGRETALAEIERHVDHDVLDAGAEAAKARHGLTGVARRRGERVCEGGICPHLTNTVGVVTYYCLCDCLFGFM